MVIFSNFSGNNGCIFLYVSTTVLYEYMKSLRNGVKGKLREKNLFLYFFPDV
jgi:hypothetical protein